MKTDPSGCIGTVTAWPTMPTSSELDKECPTYVELDDGTTTLDYNAV